MYPSQLLCMRGRQPARAKEGEREREQSVAGLLFGVEDAGSKLMEFLTATRDVANVELRR